VEQDGEHSLVVSIPRPVSELRHVLPILKRGGRAEFRKVVREIQPNESTYANPNVGVDRSGARNVMSDQDQDGDGRFTEDDDPKFELGPVELRGREIVEADARPDPESSFNWIVHFRLREQSVYGFNLATTRLVGWRLAVLVDGVVLAAPEVSRPINSVDGVIAGGLSKWQARDLAASLASGPLVTTLFEGQIMETTIQVHPHWINPGTVAAVIGACGLILVLILRDRRRAL
jgi:preprotein translocase subunit SecD